ncbi:isoprenylcysteine carboxylmethyltransferase family protein [Alteromonas sp. 345S023]|uniref:Isoprenylcysteine carboxylmethyltransferase family protein n=1 Tax=Alteromonas profundi TaxID=2696062 RepID=A0A7X5RLA2_9ALTE|nr:isoprenylcysteine carboxylmethyltransferase family protein [Alteromonas profundi]NDV91516.1 isoprenylcysteine carboxylmethyltransferase family protein [Alteromonas profundi]
MRSLELKVPPVALLLVFVVASWLIALGFPAYNFALPYRHYIALIVCALGFIFALLGVHAFRRAGTTVDPRIPQQTETLVVKGVFGVSRNPMYVGFLLALIAWCLWLENGVSVLVIPAFIVYMNQFQIKPEERFMQAKFGADYTQYTLAVRRWL